MAEARRVVLLAGRLGPDDARSVRGLADRLAGLGFSAEVVCASGGGVLNEGPGVVEWPALGSRWGRPWAVRRLASSDGPGRPELVHVLGAEMDVAGLSLAEHWGVPYIQSVDDYLPPGGRLRLGRRWCRALVTTAPWLADDLVRGAGVPRSWITLIPPGIEVSEPEPDPAPDDGSPRVPVIGAAGPLEAGAGLATFLDAARRVVAEGVDAEFVVAGDGPAEADLRRLAERVGVAGRVTFAGPLREGRTLGRLLDVFCQPSRRPSAGRALATALALGLPAIASDVDGLRAWVADGETGRLVPPGDPEALARAVIDLIADPAAARALGHRARERIAREFDPSREAAAWAALYARVLDTPADSPRPTLRGPRILAVDAAASATRRS
jgi:glycosyltransferase involved in cell wall biosynthesis